MPPWMAVPDCSQLRMCASSTVTSVCAWFHWKILPKFEELVSVTVIALPFISWSTVAPMWVYHPYRVSAA